MLRVVPSHDDRDDFYIGVIGDDDIDIDNSVDDIADDDVAYQLDYIAVDIAVELLDHGLQRDDNDRNIDVLADSEHHDRDRHYHLDRYLDIHNPPVQGHAKHGL